MHLAPSTTLTPYYPEASSRHRSTATLGSPIQAWTMFGFVLQGHGWVKRVARISISRNWHWLRLCQIFTSELSIMEILIADILIPIFYVVLLCWSKLLWLHLCLYYIREKECFVNIARFWQIPPLPSPLWWVYRIVFTHGHCTWACRSYKLKLTI